MTTKVFSLDTMPGIQRDGTVFDKQFYNDGEWVRFQRGRPRKILGYRVISDQLTGPSRGIWVNPQNAFTSIFSGYPDCRDDTMKAMQVALSLGMDRKLLIETPLMWIDKAQTWQLAHDLGQKTDPQQGGQALVDLIVEHTHTCYLGDRTQRHNWGYGCGKCPACQLRAGGFDRFSSATPLANL